jgi:hypothetical protein
MLVGFPSLENILGTGKHFYPSTLLAETLTTTISNIQYPLFLSSPFIVHKSHKGSQK